MPTTLANGFYATDVGMIRVKHITRGKLAGRIVLLLETEDYRGKSFAFLQHDNSVRFFLSFAAQSTQAHLNAIQKSFAEVVQRHERKTTYDSS